MFLTLSPLFSDSGKSAPFCNQSNNINQKLTTESELRNVEFLFLVPYSKNTGIESFRLTLIYQNTVYEHILCQDEQNIIKIK